MARECGSFDASPILKELQAIRREQDDQRQAIKLLGQLITSGDFGGGNGGNGGYQEASFGGIASAGRNILKILQVVGTILGIVTNIQRLVEKFTGKQGGESGGNSELEKLVRMIKADTAKIGGRTQAIENKVNAMERKVNDALFIINRTRPEIAKILPLERKVNDTLFIAQKTRPEIAKIVPMEKKVNDSLFVLNAIRPEIKTAEKKANDAAYAASQASSKGDKILVALAALSLSITAQFTASGLKMAALMAIETKATLAAMALQTKIILAAISAAGLRDLIIGVLREVLASQLNSLIDTALSKFFGKNNNSGSGNMGSNKELLDAINRRSDAIIVAVNNGVRGLSELELNRLTNMEKRLFKEGTRIEERLLKELYATVNRVGDAITKLMRQRFQEIDETTLKVYQILGGSEWGEIKRATFTELQPERSIESVGNALYAPNATGRIRANNLIQLIYSVAVPQYYRTGLHRLPTQLPTKIHLKNGQQETKQPVETLLDFQMWQFRQMDSALGMYPITIKYKDAQNQDKTIEIENLAEAITELVGLSLSMDSDTDILNELAIKSIGETVQNKAQLSLVIDYLKAIADFLGFRSDIEGKSMPIPINPKKNSIKGFLEKSDQQIQTLKLTEPEDNDIISKLNQLLITTGMIKAVFTKKTDNGRIEGDSIKEDLDKRDSEWDEFVDFTNNLPTALKDRGEPKARVRDKTSLIPGQSPNP